MSSAENDLELPHLHLCSTNGELVLAWMRYFADGPWTIEVGNILKHQADAIVSPANSFGRMDGGIDLQYRNFFGTRVEQAVRAAIEKRFGGEIPVGSATIVGTGSQRIPYLVVAPTMRRPRSVAHSENAYKAMRAAIVEVVRFNQALSEKESVIRRVLIPGLGTGIGGLDPFDAAEQMRKAYEEVRQTLLEYQGDVDRL